MTKPLGRVERLDNGNVSLTIDNVTAELTPANAEALARALLRRAYPREAMFIIPVDRPAS